MVMSARACKGSLRMPVPYKGAWRAVPPAAGDGQGLSSHIGDIARLRVTLRSLIERAQMQLLGAGAILMNDSCVYFKDSSSRSKALRAAMLDNCDLATLKRYDDLAGLVAVADERAARVVEGVWAEPVDGGRELILVDEASLRNWCSSTIVARSGRVRATTKQGPGAIRVGSAVAEILAMRYTESELEEIKGALRLLIREASSLNEEIDHARKFVQRITRMSVQQQKPV